MRTSLCSSAVMVLVVLLGGFVQAQQDDKPEVPATKTEAPKDDTPATTKDEKPKEDAPATTKEAPAPPSSEAKAKDEAKDKADAKDKAKKDKAAKDLDKSLSTVLKTVPPGFSSWLVGSGSPAVMKPESFPLYAYMVAPGDSGLAYEAHMGTYTGWMGLQNGLPVFASTQTGSGLGLGAQAPVLFIPWATGSTPGTPVMLTGRSAGNGYFSYLGAGPGYYIPMPPTTP